MIIRDVGPRCKSPKYKKNGHIHNDKQNHHCHDCGCQFVQCCQQYLITDDKRGLIERLLLERLSLRGICRAVGVILKWLLGFLVQCFEALLFRCGGCGEEMLVNEAIIDVVVGAAKFRGEYRGGMPQIDCPGWNGETMKYVEQES